MRVGDRSGKNRLGADFAGELRRRTQAADAGGRRGSGAGGCSAASRPIAARSERSLRTARSLALASTMTSKRQSARRAIEVGEGPGIDVVRVLPQEWRLGAGRVRRTDLACVEAGEEKWILGVTSSGHSRARGRRPGLSSARVSRWCWWSKTTGSAGPGVDPEAVRDGVGASSFSTASRRRAGSERRVEVGA